MQNIRAPLFFAAIAGTAGIALATSTPSSHPDGSEEPSSYAYVTLAISGATSTDAWDINTKGSIAGHYVMNGATHGFVGAARGRFTTMDFPGSVFTQATAINDRGEIAGTYRLAGDPVTHAFLRDTDGRFLTIDVPGATSSLPRGLSGSGDIAYEAIIGGHTTAYLRRAGSFINVEPPATFAGGAVTFSYASDILGNKVVGRYDVAPQGPRGFLFDAGTGAYETLHFPNAVSSAALGINRHDIIVGGYTRDGFRQGYVLTDGSYLPLNVPTCEITNVAGGPTCTTPRKINRFGQIVGFYADGTATKGFVAYPIPVMDVVLRP